MLPEQITYKPVEIDVAMGSVVHFTCPPLGANEHYLIYKVSKEEYHGCSTENTRRRKPTPFLRCSGPSGSQRRTLQIAELNPFGRGYKAGEEIHFISTSSGSALGIDNMLGGACEKYQMRVKLTVRKQEQPEERYRSCLRILGVQPGCCEPRHKLNEICAAQEATTTQPTPQVASVGFYLSNGPTSNVAPAISYNFSTPLSFLFSHLLSLIVRRYLL